MKNLLRVLSVLLAVALIGGSGLRAAERGKGRYGGDVQWYADPERGWVRSDERREKKQDERRESSKERRSKPKDRDNRDKGKGRGAEDY